MRSFRWAVVMSLVLSGLAYSAGKKPTEFQEPRQLSDEELRLAKERSRSNIHRYDEKLEEKPQDPPYMLIGLGVIAVLVATPFGLRAYRNTSREITGKGSAYGGGGRAPAED